VLEPLLQPRTTSRTCRLRAHLALVAAHVREARGRGAGGTLFVAGGVDGAREHLGVRRPGENKVLVVRRRRQRKAGVTYVWEARVGE
jgi:hypothetical protein